MWRRGRGRARGGSTGGKRRRRCAAFFLPPDRGGAPEPRIDGLFRSTPSGPRGPASGSSSRRRPGNRHLRDVGKPLTMTFRWLITATTRARSCASSSRAVGVRRRARGPARAMAPRPAGSRRAARPPRPRTRSSFARLVLAVLVDTARLGRSPRRTPPRRPSPLASPPLPPRPPPEPPRAPLRGVRATPWSACSTARGGGHQWRTVRCEGAGGVVAEAHECGGSAAPPASRARVRDAGVPALRVGVRRVGRVQRHVRRLRRPAPRRPLPRDRSRGGAPPLSPRRPRRRRPRRPGRRLRARTTPPPRSPTGSRVRPGAVHVPPLGRGAVGPMR